MATSKKYNEFPAGTYDPAKIILQSNTGTGQLSKISLGSIINLKLFVGVLLTTDSSILSFTASLNTLGSTLSASRTGTGLYSIESEFPGIFSPNTAIVLGQPFTNNGYYVYSYESELAMKIACFDFDNNALDQEGGLSFLLVIQQ